MMASVVNLKPFFSSSSSSFLIRSFIHSTSYLFVPFDSVKSIKKKRNGRKWRESEVLQTEHIHRHGKTIQIEKKEEGCLQAVLFPFKSVLLCVKLRNTDEENFSSPPCRCRQWQHRHQFQSNRHQRRTTYERERKNMRRGKKALGNGDYGDLDYFLIPNK